MVYVLEDSYLMDLSVMAHYQAADCPQERAVQSSLRCFFTCQPVLSLRITTVFKVLQMLNIGFLQIFSKSFWQIPVYAPAPTYFQCTD